MMTPSPYRTLYHAAALPSRLVSAASRPMTMAPPVMAPAVTQCNFSVLNRPPPNYPGHIPLTRWERAALAVSSGITTFLDPAHRNDMLCAFGETTVTPYFIYRLRDVMLADPTGRRILRDRPRITAASLDLDRLRMLPSNTVGRTYVSWLDREGVSPNTRVNVKYIDDAECAYVFQRYRESHDFLHTLTGLPIVREGEIALKAFEFMNTLIPMTGLSTLSYFTVKADQRARLRQIYMPWALRNGLRAKEVINVYWEEWLERDVNELRKELGIELPPDMRTLRKKEKEEKKMAGKVIV
ncbi:Ubiquinone biosynthesis protein COQ4, mitochondrial [Ceratocystis fimbriata CBS 114723]|uniref:4-hydroxy-3-methoxy-5-polyprenylbenzoate decarboxylase n=1 Tax=Ceratocystis fimbriata CBS 114723 TaxID=1035309 RepID=A0A2C5WJN7_9PEZI|nr:Ubiquinone biosynthesis protein COQ4, mitochondrial [Ceratocystis fimbriata CBS 114723]